MLSLCRWVCLSQGLVHYMTIAMVSNIMRLIRDDEILISLEYIEKKIELFSKNYFQRNKFDLIFGVKMLELIIIVPYLILSFVLYLYKNRDLLRRSLFSWDSGVWFGQTLST